ncbi:MAG: hypothetical protein A2114_01655 [Candidatus Vogelbacteria bacterium GWA1_51_14]|uniref:DUF8173 domain-containing protein n=1 Tax=Candidatus Vogelbacteria bacterium GWA1_51_14 TaxID=1802435 RepID=A0A1G2QBZ1_9BACT|nr:MAG: hypothetical protein A2114_01655 [Candidatus Vogelbacteria bacterium GWA1_51_14]
MSKNLILGGLVLGLMLVPVAASAAAIETGQQYLLPRGEEVRGNLYIGSGHASIAGAVIGDLYVGAGSAVVAGLVVEDLVVAGGNITVTGEVLGDVRVFGGNVTIAGPVGGDLFVLGGSLELDSAVAGDVDFTGGALRLGDEARVGGDLSYRTDRPATISEQAVVLGETVYDESLARQLGIWRQADRGSMLVGLTALLGAWLFLKLLMLLFAGLVLYSLLRQPLERVVRRGLDKPGRSLVTGFASALSIPVLAIILMLTIIGIPLALTFAAAYLALIIVAKVMAGVLVGVWLDRVILKQERFRLTWVTVAAGVTVFFLLSRVPLVGWVLGAVVTLLVFGAMIDLLINKWRATSA